MQLIRQRYVEDVTANVLFVDSQGQTHHMMDFIIASRSRLFLPTYQIVSSPCSKILQMFDVTCPRPPAP